VPRLEKVIEDLDWLCDRVSTQVRTFSVALLAITWGLLIGEPEIAQPLPLWLKKNLLGIGVLAVLALFGDFLQYFFGMLDTDNLRKSMEEKGLTEAEYDYRTINRKLRDGLFWLKFAIVVIAGLWFVGVMIPFCVSTVRTPTP
jgi:hypothetical protein